MLNTSRQRELCHTVFQKLEDYATSQHSNVASIFRNFDKDQGGTLSTEEMLEALGKICSGDLPPEQSQAVMKELDKHGTGEVSFEKMFGTIREFKSLKRLARSDGRSLAPDSVVRRFTNGRWINPTLQRRQRVQRVTGMGTLVEKWQPLEVGTPSAADTVKHVNIKYTDYTGTAGGTVWHQIGKRPRAEGRRTMQPPPSGTLFHRGKTLAEVFKSGPDRQGRSGANHPDNRAPWRPHSQRPPRAAGCSGFVAPRAVAPLDRPGSVTLPSSRPALSSKHLVRPATVAGSHVSGEERRLRSKNSKTDKSKAFWETAGLHHPIDRPAMAKSTTQSRTMVESTGRPNIRLALNVDLCSY